MRMYTLLESVLWIGTDKCEIKKDAILLDEKISVDEDAASCIRSNLV